MQCVRSLLECLAIKLMMLFKRGAIVVT
uniref:Uncharacterized protein n=1 Tax=Rhizophora mucronata TaxID=61149 RepID=A0A2P2J6M5_RHIMU